MRQTLWFTILALCLLLQPGEALAQRRGEDFVSADPATVEQFRALFNQEMGLARLVLMFSPT